MPSHFIRTSNEPKKTLGRDITVSKWSICIVNSCGVSHKATAIPKCTITCICSNHSIAWLNPTWALHIHQYLTLFSGCHRNHNIYHNASESHHMTINQSHKIPYLCVCIIIREIYPFFLQASYAIPLLCFTNILGSVLWAVNCYISQLWLYSDEVNYPSCYWPLLVRISVFVFWGFISMISVSAVTILLVHLDHLCVLMPHWDHS